MYGSRVSSPAVGDPVALFQLVGHPLRWGLLSDLSRSDRTVRELTEHSGQSQNLVSYHLGKLRAAHLVTARQSSADRRDTYYSVDLDRLRHDLSTSGGTMHPGLRTMPEFRAAHPVHRPSRTATNRVLFLCTGNSARSQMAEALVRTRSAGVVEAHSAGSHPKGLHPNAVRAMAELGIDIGGHVPKHLDAFVDQRFDRVISLCDRVREVCPEFPAASDTVHWSIADPAAQAALDHDNDNDLDAGIDVFRRTAAELDGRISFLLAALEHERRLDNDPGDDRGAEPMQPPPIDNRENQEKP